MLLWKTILLIFQTLYSEKVSKTYSILFKASTFNEMVISSIQCCLTNIVKLTPISENSIHSKYINSFSDLILVDKYKEWKAEKILNSHAIF